jgi:hypothetical protein
VSDFDPTHSSRKTARERIAENDVKSMNSTPLSVCFAAKVTHPSPRFAPIREKFRIDVMAARAKTGGHDVSQSTLNSIGG